MSIKQYNILRMVTTITIAMIVSISVVEENYLIASATVLIGILTLFTVKKNMKEVLSDERDYEIAGRAARYTINIFSTGAVFTMFILLSFKNMNTNYEVIASTIGYSTCLLMVIYSIIAGNYQRKINASSKKIFFLVMSMGLLLITLIAGVRLFSGEDTWICENGKWIEHGKPNTSMPSKETCK